MNLVIFGPPGAGKGTQSIMLVKEFNLIQLSTGDLLREEAKKKSSFGTKIQDIMNSGALVPDDIINILLEKKVSTPEYFNKIIFDGYPRNIDQAKSLDNLLKKYNQKMDIALNLKVKNEILVKRIAGRLTCSICNKIFNTFFDPPKNCGMPVCSSRKLKKRLDDNEETISKRLKIYDEKTFPIIDYYVQKGIMKNVDGMQEIQSISDQLITIIKRMRD